VARYREYSYDQILMLPVKLANQLQPGTFEQTINTLVDTHIDLGVFDERYRNDETGAPAISPAILLKIVLFAYSRGIVSSREIARACEENVVFMALAADTRPHFTTIADFIARMGTEIAGVFRDVLTVCYTEGLIGRTMFAIDGCKISSNCAKEWSGTKAELVKKADKIERSIKDLVSRHRQEDERGERSAARTVEEKTVETLSAKADRITRWLAEHEDRIGTRGKPVKSNITDNESAKMVSSHGVIQGYNGIATVDEKHQIVVDAQAVGDGHEAQHVESVVESVAETAEALDPQGDLFDETVVTADSGFHSEASVKAVLDRGIDAYIADNHFRQRDPGFADQQTHKKKTTDKRKTSKARKYFTATDFVFDDAGTLICPAGHPMKSRNPNYRDRKKGYTGKTYSSYATRCSACHLRSRCLRNPHSPVRQVTKLDGARSYTQRMIDRFDSPQGRYWYRRRLGTVEPVFANIRSTMGLDRFTLRGQKKVDTQWKLYCIVHNIGKLSRYGPSFQGPRGALR